MQKKQEKGYKGKFGISSLYLSHSDTQDRRTNRTLPEGNVYCAY